MNDVFAPSGCINGVEGIHRLGFQNVAVDHTNGESAFTGCSYKINRRYHGDRINQVTVRWDSTGVCI